jgi:hypothetical protein
MVLTEDEYREAKSNSGLSSLFNLRKVTKSYIIQCLADREIQCSVNDLGHQSKAYGYNCKVIHSPEKYADVSYVTVSYNFDNLFTSKSCSINTV